MPFLISLMEEVIAAVQSDPALSDVAVIKAYPAESKPNPIKRSILAVGLSSVKAQEGAFGGYLGMSGGAGLLGKQLQVTLSLRLYTPTLFGGERCVSLFSQVCDRLLFSPSLSVSGLSCTPLTYQSTASAFLIEGLCTCRLYTAQSEEPAGIEQIVVQRA